MLSTQTLDQPITERDGESNTTAIEIKQTELTADERRRLTRYKLKAAFTNGAILGNLLSTVVALLVYVLFSSIYGADKGKLSPTLIMAACTTFVIDTFFLIWAYRSPLDFTDHCFSTAERQDLETLMKKESSLSAAAQIKSISLFLSTETGSAILDARNTTRTTETQEWIALMINEKNKLSAILKAMPEDKRREYVTANEEIGRNKIFQQLESSEKKVSLKYLVLKKMLKKTECILPNESPESSDSGEYLKSLTIPPKKKNRWGELFHYFKRKQASKNEAETASLDTQSHRSYSTLA
ncbi:MAG: hypothetical protein NTZ67_09825 [Gammaproteobacteria bacterium]|nr:hypothetical protein [Gammaproteobacteria bacterium]